MEGKKEIVISHFYLFSAKLLSSFQAPLRNAADFTKRAWGYMWNLNHSSLDSVIFNLSIGNNRTVTIHMNEY